MKIKTALILSAGFGERLNPLTLERPKPLLELNNISMLENCINSIIKLEVKKIFVNTFYLSNQIFNFIKNKNFPINIQVINDGKKILNTGGGILNLISNSDDEDCIIFNPDTLWSENYINEIIEMQNFYFSNKLNNILLVVNKKLSFDDSLRGDFKFENNLLKKNENKDSIYIGCQILNKNLFKNYKIKNFPISVIWDELLKKNQLNGFESSKKFYHLTSLETFKKLRDL